MVTHERFSSRFSKDFKRSDPIVSVKVNVEKVHRHRNIVITTGSSVVAPSRL